MVTVIQARSRRDFMTDMALALGGAVLAAAVVAPKPASAKVGPQDVGYRPTPNGKARCLNCVQWESPDACKLVSGRINPDGWCSIYARKS